MSERLDDLLSTPLPDVPDSGFSARVRDRIVRGRRWEEWLTYAVIGLAALPLLFVIPIASLDVEFSRLMPSLASIEPLALAVALLLLTFSFERLIHERA
jgi:hypothetical protein